MHDSNGTGSDLPPDYLQMILTKTRNDRQLAFTIFSQLFTELPGQLDDIQNALNLRQFDLARQSTHKLHGSLSLCGLENIRKQAHNLEQCLANNNYGSINRYWFQLQQCVFDFTTQQQVLLEELARDIV